MLKTEDEPKLKMNQKKFPKNLQSTTGGAVMKERESKHEFRWTFQRRRIFPWLEKKQNIEISVFLNHMAVRLMRPMNTMTKTHLDPSKYSIFNFKTQGCISIWQGINNKCKNCHEAFRPYRFRNAKALAYLPQP
jgi:hypothetical protein